MQFETGERSGNLVCQLEQASFGYGDKEIVAPFDLTIMRGDKVGILGRNGVGKSTLLKGILGKLPPLAGSVRLGTKLDIAYFDQTRDLLDPDKTAEENVGQGKTTIQIGGKSKHIIGYLQDFLFTPEQARSPIRYFSGGQKNRLLLAKLLAQPANMLVMDEPTNDLDSETLELLEERLVEYEGTLIVVSHDRAFLNNCVTSLLVFEDGAIKEYVGGYDDWLRQKKAELTGSNNPKNAQRGSASATIIKEPAATNPKSGVEKKLSFKEKQELDGLPAKIESLEAEQKSIHDQMASVDYFKQPATTLAADQSRLAKIEEELARAYERWESLSERG
jgi:ATP-binding cassette subfamily F protein uup